MPKSKITVEKPTNADDLTLVVGQVSGKKLKGFRLSIHGEVASALRDACVATVDQLNGRTELAYKWDISYDPNLQFLGIADALLTIPSVDQGASTPHTTQPQQVVETDPQARLILDSASSLPLLPASELKKRTFLFYAAVVGNDPNNRTSFVSRWNPYSTTLCGRILTLYGRVSAMSLNRF